MQGTRHWTSKGGAKLFLWRKAAAAGAAPRGTILFVHGSSMASQATFDLHVPGRPHSSAMEWKLRALGVTTTQRWPDLPDVPTIAEAGVAGYEATLWLCVLAPAGTPEAIVTRLSEEIGKTLQDPEMLKQLRNAGIGPSYLGPRELGAYMRAEHEKWGRVVRDTGATIN